MEHSANRQHLFSPNILAITVILTNCRKSWHHSSIRDTLLKRKETALLPWKQHCYHGYVYIYISTKESSCHSFNQFCPSMNNGNLRFWFPFISADLIKSLWPAPSCTYICHNLHNTNSLFCSIIISKANMYPYLTWLFSKSWLYNL